MTVPSRRKYTADFKAQILELADHGRPVSELAQEFGVSAGLIHAWKRKIRSSSPPKLGSGGEVVPAKRDDEDVAHELRRLQRQVSDLQLENDILKKAAVILGTKPQPKSAR